MACHLSDHAKKIIILSAVECNQQNDKNSKTFHILFIHEVKGGTRNLSTTETHAAAATYLILPEVYDIHEHESYA